MLFRRKPKPEPPHTPIPALITFSIDGESPYGFRMLHITIRRANVNIVEGWTSIDLPASSLDVYVPLHPYQDIRYCQFAVNEGSEDEEIPF